MRYSLKSLKLRGGIGVLVLGLLTTLSIAWASPDQGFEPITTLSTPNIPGNGEDRFCIQDLEFFPDTNTYQVINNTRDCLPGIQFPDFPGLSIKLNGGPEYLEDPYLAAWPFESMVPEYGLYMFAYLFDNPANQGELIMEADVHFLDRSIQGDSRFMKKLFPSGINRNNLIDERAFQSERCFLRHHYKINQEGTIRSYSLITLNGFLQQTIVQTRRILREEYWQCSFATFNFVKRRGERLARDRFTIPEDIIAEYYTKPLGHIYD